MIGTRRIAIRGLAIAGVVAACSPDRPPAAGQTGSAVAGSGAPIDAVPRAEIERRIRDELALQVVSIDALTCPGGELVGRGSFECQVGFTAFAHHYHWTRAGGRPGTWTGALSHREEIATVEISTSGVVGRFLRLSRRPARMTELDRDVRDRVERAFTSIRDPLDAIDCPEVLGGVPAVCTATAGDRSAQLELVAHGDQHDGTVKVGWRTPRPPGGCSEERTDPRDPTSCRPEAYPSVIDWTQ